MHPCSPKPLITSLLALVLATTLLWSCASSNRSRADKQYDTGNYDKAEQLYRQTLQHNPADDDARYRLALVYGRQERLSKSRDEFIKLIERNPNYAKAYYNLAVLYSTPGLTHNQAKAVVYFEGYLQRTPNAPQRAGIESWLRRYKTKQGPGKADTLKKRTVPRDTKQRDNAAPTQPAATDFKDWLIKQSGEIGD
ncbi:MAG: tetratricopeptide repeat protein [Deltaproteobacteria bacterium]|nr:tetratricopeptide repeat protein [Deltaproteobacteria bacterium]